MTINPVTIYLPGRRTSVRLEPELQDALVEIADLEQVSLGELYQFIGEHYAGRPLSSACRAFAVRYFHQRAA